MHFFDLHCDTLYRALTEKKSLDDDSLGVSFKKIFSLSLYAGCFAVWIPDTLRGERAMSFFDKAVNLLEKSIKQGLYEIDFFRNSNDLKKIKNSKSGHGIILSIEGGAVLGGKLENIYHLYESGVRMMTLTWNGPCEIGDGIGVDHSKGLSDFGRRVVTEMERLKIIVDLSHASEKLFYDVAEITRRPFVLSHSNSKFICKNPRNITDDQFGIVKERSGVVGINLYKEFLSEEKDAVFDDVRRHIEHFLELGGENNLAFGSDFDGAEVLQGIEDVSKIGDLYEYFLIKNYSEKLLNKIFFENAYEFILKNID